jgi:site-specific DNA-methyltransferase (adenine-specific)
MKEPLVFHGNNIELLRDLQENSIDSIVTDPPYELGFMGKKWDSSGIAYSVELWAECLRVLKPGGHLLAFSGSRTYHRMTVAIEDAGFEIRDQIMWVYGSGFPKSLDVAKAINKAAGVEYEAKPASGVGFMNNTDDGYNTTLNQLVQVGESTGEAQEWKGWGTALKPAHEPIVMARKPVEGTVANNVLRYGTGAINVDGCRIPSNDGFEKAWDKPVITNIGAVPQNYGIGIGDGVSHTVDISGNKPNGGRWPANFIHDGSEEVLALFPDTKSTSGKKRLNNTNNQVYSGNWNAQPDNLAGFDDSGSAARFFYCAKAGKSERNAGLEELPERRPDERSEVGMGTFAEKGVAVQSNFHPTVKPLTLMRYLVRLVTPPNGTVLDPFAGSGTTLVAAVLENFNSVGMEMTADYMPIIKGRVNWALNQNKQPHSLFDI